MKAKVGVLMLAALVLLPTSQAGSPVTATTNAPADQQLDATIVEIHEQALDALASSRRGGRRSGRVVPTGRVAQIRARFKNFE